MQIHCIILCTTASGKFLSCTVQGSGGVNETLTEQGDELNRVLRYHRKASPCLSAARTKHGVKADVRFYGMPVQQGRLEREIERAHARHAPDTAPTPPAPAPSPSALTVAAAIALLHTLDRTELLALRASESNGKARVTLLKAIDAELEKRAGLSVAF